MNINEIKKLLSDNFISFEGVYEHTDRTIEVVIEWGDWKHDHLLCDEIMSKNGYVLIGEYETDEDGSDCYSSNHQYMLK